MSMTRRSFLKVIATIAAAASTADVAKLLPAPPPVVPPMPVYDWKQWHKFAVMFDKGAPRFLIDGTDVGLWPELVQKVAKFISPTGSTGAPGISLKRETPDSYFEVNVREATSRDRRSGTDVPVLRYDVDGLVREVRLLV